MPISRPETKPAKVIPTATVSKEQIIVGEHLADLRSRVRWLTWISGVCWTALVLLGGLLISGTLDWLIHFDDSGTRLVIGLILVGSSGWMMWRNLIAPLRQQLSGSFLASRVERRFPGLRSRVLSAVEFLDHRLDARLGSPELQHAVVGQALKDLERIEPSDIIESGAVRNVSLGGAFVLALTLIMVLLHPLEAATSVQRLLFPFSKVPWPRAVELQFVQTDLSPLVQTSDQPMLIARGDTLELYVENRRGRLPDRVYLEYRIGEEGPLVREVLRQTTLRDQKGRTVDAAIINWIAARGTMFFRATGGDDNAMEFRRVEVVPPPNVESLQVSISPPAYSTRPAETLPPGVGHVQGLLGTKVQVVATCDKPLQSAKLRIGDQPTLPLSLNEDRRSFSAMFEITEPRTTNYWFELTDERGFTDREAVRYELRGIADVVPEVAIEDPIADVMLTADAELPVKILAKDDLGLSIVRMTFQIGDEETLRTIPLFDSTTATTDVPEESVDDQSKRSSPLGPQRHEADYLWKLADLKLSEGTKIVFRGEALDTFDLGSKHLGRSIPRTITIISSSEKQKELAGRVGELLDDLQQATQLQQRARQQTEELQTQLENVGELRSQDLDQLQRTELDQRQTASRLSRPADGVEAQARQLLSELRTNRLNDAGTEQRLERLTEELNRLQREELPDAEQALTRAQKLADGASQQKSSGKQAQRQGQKGERSGHGKDASSDQNPSKPQNAEDSSANDAGQPSLPTDAKQNSADAKSPLKQSKKNPGKAQTGTKSGSVGSNEDSKENEGENASGQPDEKSNENNAADPESKQSNSDNPAKGQSADERHQAPMNPEQKALEAALAEAKSQQTRSLETLQSLQDSLSEWRDRRDVSSDIESVIAEQEKVQKEAAELAAGTMSKSSAELSKQEGAELKKLFERQNKIAEQLDKFTKQLERASDSLKQHDPDTAERFNEVDQELKQKQTSGDMRAAARNILDNQMGEASRTQQQALDQLREIERMIKQQPNEDTEQVVKQTEEALKEFQQIRQQQEDLADRAEQLGQQPDSPEKQEQMKDLMEQQEQLAERMAKAERKLERLRLHGPAEAAHRARKRLNEMMKDMQDADDADEMQQAMDEALDDLEQVERELVLEKRLAQERLAFEQLEKIEDELKALRARQETVIAETARLEQEKQQRDGLTRGQAKTLLDLSETERSLQHSAEQMQQQMASAEVFALAVKRLGRTLQLAADRLGERETSDPVQNLEKDAIKKIDNLLAVLKQEQKKQQPQQPQEKPEELANEPQEQQDKPEEAQPPGDSIPQLAQLKLLKSLQEEYLEQTELLNSFRDKDGKLPEAMQAELTELAREQAELADFARNLIAKFLQAQPDRKPHDDQKPEEQTPEKEQKPAEPQKPQKEIDPNKIDL